MAASPGTSQPCGVALVSVPFSTLWLRGSLRSWRPSSTARTSGLGAAQGGAGAACEPPLRRTASVCLCGRPGEPVSQGCLPVSCPGPWPAWEAASSGALAEHNSRPCSDVTAARGRGQWLGHQLPGKPGRESRAPRGPQGLRGALTVRPGLRTQGRAVKSTTHPRKSALCLGAQCHRGPL